ncbi:hypothetical protein DFQ27_003154 [Actinomortierella ambigua]|uniref:Uncharacterized protein n=1 Tax=Actinomortierella ambigua TaxID=1343610 RepID=A0A9P6U583_9FUNG|nr:hypothetical protein DFQ27_003154 [Actinomortierella ambigua]
MSAVVRICKLDDVEPERFVTSNIVRPKTLLIIRSVLTLYIWSALLSTWITARSAGGYLRFFTNLSFIGLCFYMLCTCIWSFGYLRQTPTSRVAWLNDRSPWWARLHQLLYSSIICFHFVVPIVFWTMLSVGMDKMTTVEKWQNVSVHAFDGVVALSELILNRNVLVPRHSVIVASVMVLYMFLTFVVYASDGTWVYPFLNWSKGPIVAASYVGIGVGMFIIFFLLMIVHRLRNNWGDRRPVVLELASHQQSGSLCKETSATELNIV